MLSVQPTNELSAPVLCRQKVFSGRLKSSFGGVRIVDWVRKTVPGGRTSNGERPAAVRVESVTWYMQQILLSRMEMSLAGQQDSVKGEVLRCPTIRTSIHHVHQLEHHTMPYFIRMQTKSKLHILKAIFPTFLSVNNPIL